LFGSIAYNPPSRFLREIPKELFHADRSKGGRGATVSSFDPDDDEGEANRLRRPPAQKEKLWVTGPKTPRQEQQAAQNAGFKVGNKVRHATFGVGVVLNVTGTGDDTTIEAVFPNVGPKKLLLSLTKLERVN
jgi:DNA helicase-2/ATP-dependent DNA helicase PcrA